MQTERKIEGNFCGYERRVEGIDELLKLQSGRDIEADGDMD